MVLRFLQVGASLTVLANALVVADEHHHHDHHHHQHHRQHTQQALRNQPAEKQGAVRSTVSSGGWPSDITLRLLAPVPFLQGEAIKMLFGTSFSSVNPGDVIKVPAHDHLQADQVNIDQQRLASSHPVLDTDGNVRDSAAILAGVLSTATSLSVWFVAVLAFALLYKMRKLSPSVDLDKARGVFKDQPFIHGPFDCFGDMEVCCWSTWCTGVQWADSMNAVGILSFWLALSVFLVAQSVNIFTGGLVWVLVALIFTYYRQELRRSLDMRNDGNDALLDFALWCCCACCAVAQEARQIKAAPKLSKVEEDAA